MDERTSVTSVADEADLVNHGKDLSRNFETQESSTSDVPSYLGGQQKIPRARIKNLIKQRLQQ